MRKRADPSYITRQCSFGSLVEGSACHFVEVVLIVGKKTVDNPYCCRMVAAVVAVDVVVHHVFRASLALDAVAVVVGSIYRCFY